MESHSKSGNRSVDKQRVEVLGPDGHYQPDSDTETETIKVNDSTTRTVVRTYQVGWQWTKATVGGDGRGCANDSER